MSKILGVKSLLDYLVLADFPITEKQLEEYVARRKIPHKKSYGDIIFFDPVHIDWWIAEQRKIDSAT